MSRKQKKRNKPYTGADATPSKPVVRHYVAVERSALGEWWQTHKKTVKIIAAIIGVVFIGIFSLTQLFRAVF